MSGQLVPGRAEIVRRPSHPTYLSSEHRGSSWERRRMERIWSTEGKQSQKQEGNVAGSCWVSAWDFWVLFSPHSFSLVHGSDPLCPSLSNFLLAITPLDGPLTDTVSCSLGLAGQDMPGTSRRTRSLIGVRSTSLQKAWQWPHLGCTMSFAFSLLVRCKSLTR